MTLNRLSNVNQGLLLLERGIQNVRNVSQIPMHQKLAQSGVEIVEQRHILVLGRLLAPVAQKHEFSRSQILPVSANHDLHSRMMVLR